MMTGQEIQEQVDHLKSLNEHIEPIWKNALAARNKADDALHAVRELRMRISERENELLKQALKESQVG